MPYVGGQPPPLKGRTSEAIGGSSLGYPSKLLQLSLGIESPSESGRRKIPAQTKSFERDLENSLEPYRDERKKVDKNLEVTKLHSSSQRFASKQTLR